MRGVCTHSKCLKSQYTAARHCQGSGQIGSAITHSSSACQRIVCVARQVFVANPNKTPAIVDILAGNKEKLLRYLKDFHNDTSARSYCMLLLLRGLLSNSGANLDSAHSSQQKCMPVRQGPQCSIAQSKSMYSCRRRAVQGGEGGDHKGDQHVGAQQVTQARPAAAGRVGCEPRRKGVAWWHLGSSPGKLLRTALARYGCVIRARRTRNPSVYHSGQHKGRAQHLAHSRRSLAWVKLLHMSIPLNHIWHMRRLQALPYLRTACPSASSRSHASCRHSSPHLGG